jgi:energy-coupling factor transporter ATP-binding protein EcfA2
VRVGHEVKPGYFAQDHHELLPDPNQKPLDYVWNVVPTEGTSYVRGQLGRVLFSGEDVEKPIGSLSGGECARLIFGRIIVEKPNLLVLDEPTNHLDMEAIAALAEGLSQFEGTVVFVSHDRWFVSALATRILEVTPDGPRDFPGTYSEYLARLGDDHLDADAVVLKAKGTRAPRSEAPPAASTAPSWEEQKRARNRLRALPGLRDEIVARIDAAEARKKEIATMYEEPGFFERTAPDRVKALVAEDEGLTKTLDDLMVEWDAIEKEIEAGAKAN